MVKTHMFSYPQMDQHTHTTHTTHTRAAQRGQHSISLLWQAPLNCMKASGCCCTNYSGELLSFYPHITVSFAQKVTRMQLHFLSVSNNKVNWKCLNASELLTFTHRDIHGSKGCQRCMLWRERFSEINESNCDQLGHQRKERIQQTHLKYITSAPLF